MFRGFDITNSKYFKLMEILKQDGMKFSIFIRECIDKKIDEAEVKDHE